MRIKNTLIVTNGLMIVTILSGLVLASSTVSAETTTVDDVTFLVPAACTLSATGSTLHTATINPGTYTADIGTTTLKAVCNDGAGFAIYATGYTGNIIGETNSNKLVGETTNLAIATGTATSGSTSNWAMKLATDSNATYPITIENSFNAYHAVPNAYTKVASRATATDGGSSAVGSTLTTTYGVFIASTQAADTYEGKVIYTLVHPASHATPVACSPDATTIAQAQCMQDFATGDTAAIKASMTAEQQYTLKDKRDNKTYTVAKLADGNVWMTKNLDLDLDSSVTYTNEDTDIGYNTTTHTYDAAAWMPMRSTYTTAGTWCEGGMKIVSPYVPTAISDCLWNYTPESYDPGNLYWDSNNFSVTSSGIPQYHIGNYYNWSAAIATNNGEPFLQEDEDAGQSICPAGWALYNYDDEWMEYGVGVVESGVSASVLTESPLYHVLGGTIVVDSAEGVGTVSYYWDDWYMYDNSAWTAYIDYNEGTWVADAYQYTKISAGNFIRCRAR